METTTARYYRIVLLADPQWGEGSLSWRVKEVLESQGHTVFFFSPQMHPFAFTGDEKLKGARTVRSASLERFFAEQAPDVIILADGVNADVSAMRDIAVHAIVGGLCEGASQVRMLEHTAVNSGQKLDFAWIAEGPAWRSARACENLGCLQRLESLVDRGFVDTSLVNTIAYEPGVLCVQNATEDRIRALQDLVQCDDMRGVPIRCFGAGWPHEWACEVHFSEFIYAAKSSCAVVFFPCEEEGDSELAQAPVALACSVGASLLTWEEGGFVSSVPSAASSRFLDDCIEAGLDELRDRFAGGGKMRGSSSPRKVACILGYFGMGNFGDEYILATLDKRLRAGVSGISVVAVSENPQHTLEHRGVYALTLKQQRAVDMTLAHSSVAMVVAGLLFDQGIRWTMGKAELLSSLRYSTIPGIAGYVALADMNNAKPVMYGIGAGPLDVGDSRKLVELMGKLGAVFLSRDEETARLIQACGVPADQAIRKADTAFLGFDRHSSFVDEWMTREFGSASVDNASITLLAVSLREYENLPVDYDARIACAFDDVARRHPGVHFAFCTLDPDDLGLAQRIIERMENGERAHLFASGDDIEAVCDLLSRCDGGFSMRYHCSLILNRNGRPCVGMDYLPKVTSLYVEMGCADLLVSTQATSVEITAKLEMLLNDRGHWADVVERGSASLRELSQQAESMLLAWVEEHAQGKSFMIEKEFYLNDQPECDSLLGKARREVGELRDKSASLEGEIDVLHSQVGMLECEVDRLRAELDAVRASHSFKVGLALTAAPRALRSAFRK